MRSSRVGLFGLASCQGAAVSRLALNAEFTSGSPRLVFGKRAVVPAHLAARNRPAKKMAGAEWFPPDPGTSS
jgi:hypothetical protein